MSAVSVAGTVNTVLKWVGYFIVLVGLVWAAAAIWFGFDATEPWIYGGILVDEDWQSVTLGFLSAAWILAWTGFLWSFAQVGRLVAVYLASKSPVID